MRYILIAMLCLYLSSCDTNSGGGEKKTYQVDIEWELESINLAAPAYSEVSLTIINSESFDLGAGDWELHYNQMEGYAQDGSLSPEFNIRHITGDYFVLSPTDLFMGISRGASHTFRYRLNFVVPRISFAPDGFFLVYQGVAKPLNNVVIKGFDNKTLQALQPADAMSHYISNEQLAILPAAEVQTVFPSPVKQQYSKEPALGLGSVTLSYTPDLEFEATVLQSALLDDFGIESKNEADAMEIQLSLTPGDEDAVEGQYHLRISTEGIDIEAPTASGIFYGIQSLLQLIESNSEGRNIVRCQEIIDQPRFGYRGCHLDVARNFFPVEEVKEYLDLMSKYKLNKFHFHLTDDEGWRLEIPGLPELTEVGARRGYTTDEDDRLFPAYGSGPDPDLSPGSGFYTTNEFIDILNYAKQRHIEVIPEIGFPGHARAAIKAMESRYHRLMKAGKEAEAIEYLLSDFEDQSVYSSAQHYSDNVICVCLPGAEKFVIKVIETLEQLYDQAGLPLKRIHTGGDEIPYGAWQRSPVCDAYLSKSNTVNASGDLPAEFFMKIKSYLDARSIEVAGWEEIVLLHTEAGHEGIEINEDLVGQDVIPYVWNAVLGWGRDDMTYKLANQGFEVIMCNSAAYYFDMAYDRGVMEKGLSWSGYSDTKMIYETEPLNIYKRSTTDVNGRPLTAEYLKSREQLTTSGRLNFAGIQSQIWTETLKTEKDLYYMAFPKIVAFAEKAWSPEPAWALVADQRRADLLFEDAWNRFCNGIGQRMIPRVEKTKIGTYMRIPPPGAKVENGMLVANTRFPGLDIRYTTDGSEPDSSSTLYTEPLSTETEVIKLKAFTPGGLSSQSSLVRKVTR